MQSLKTIARRNNKAFLSESPQRNRGKQENGKAWRSLQENQRYQGNISCKDGLDKGQKWYGLTEAEEISKRCQDYREELPKKC